MKKAIKITIVVAIVAVIAAVLVWYFVLKRPTVEKKQDGAELYQVTTEETELNVRKGPGVENEKIGSLAKGSIVNVSEIKDGWAFLPTYNGYVSMEYLTKQK